MSDSRAQLSDSPLPTEVRVPADASRTAAGPPPGRAESRSGGQRLLLLVAAILLLVLIRGGIYVAMTFLATEPTPQSPAGGTELRPGRGAEAIEAALAAAHDYANNREYAKAEAILSQAVSEHPSDEPLRLELARTLVAEQKFAEAYPHYQAALAIAASGQAPSAPAAAGSSPDPQADAKRIRLLGDPRLHFEAGTIASKAGLLDRAEEHYSMAQSGDMTDPRYPLFLGMIQLRQNKEAAAQASLVRAVTLDPSQSAAWGTLAELSLKNNQLGLALQHIEKARALDPQTPRWRLVQARALKRRGDKGDVELAAQLLLAMDKSDQLRPESLAAISECYGMLRRPADAAALYAEASRLRPTDADAAYLAATWYQRAADTDQALRYAKAAASLGHELARSLVTELTAGK